MLLFDFAAAFPSVDHIYLARRCPECLIRAYADNLAIVLPNGYKRLAFLEQFGDEKSQHDAGERESLGVSDGGAACAHCTLCMGEGEDGDQRARR